MMTGSNMRNAERAAAIDGLLDHPVEQNLPRPQGVPLGLGRLERILEPAHLALGDGDDDLFLGLELPVDRRLGHAHRVGDHLQRRAADAALGDQFQRRVQYAGLRGGAGDRAEPAVLLCGRHSDEGSRGIDRQVADRLPSRLPIGNRTCR